MPYETQKLGYYREAINNLEGLKDEFDYIGVSESISSILQELIDACRYDLQDMEAVELNSPPSPSKSE